MAKLAQTVRFDEIIKSVRTAAQQPQGDLLEEIEQLHDAYTNVIRSRVNCLEAISSVGQRADSEEERIVLSFKKIIEKDIEIISSDVLELVNNTPIPNSTTEERRINFHKLKGDCQRYLAEFQNGDARKESAAKALEAYSSASSIATSDLPPTHPIRLGLALKFSPLYAESLFSHHPASDLKPFSEALTDLNADFDEWLNVLVERRNQQAKADQEQKEFDERTIYDVIEMAVAFIKDRIRDDAFKAVAGVRYALNTKRNISNLLLTVRTGVDLTTEYNAIRLYIDSIYRDSHVVKIVVEPEREYFERIEQYPQGSVGSCCLS